VVTGLLMALTVSPTLPLYAVAAGSAVGIIIGKEIFGGYGKNLLNPALFGRFFIIYAFPGTMNPWLSSVDGVSTVTPLQLMRGEGIMTPAQELFLGNVAGSIGETSALLLLIGAGWLIFKRYANWRIPLSIIASVIVISLLTGQNILFHLLSGSLILGAFFMATDPVSSPKTQAGRYIFGLGVGLLIMAMRLWGWLPEGTTFAILGMNVLVPFINRLTRPKIQ
jgi:Na+-translocating ferredoxin:NAD+ oxidoreductase subunit D